VAYFAFGDGPGLETRALSGCRFEIPQGFRTRGGSKLTGAMSFRIARSRISAAKGLFYARNRRPTCWPQDRHCGPLDERHADRPPGGLLLAPISARRPRDALCLRRRSLRWINWPRRLWWAPPACAAARSFCNQRPRPEVVEFPRNVQTRLKKLADGVAECTFPCGGGLNRLDMQHVPRHPPRSTIR